MDTACINTQKAKFMSKVVVTGAAGFIGSFLSEELIAQGHEVVGVDAFIPYYPREIKEKNLTALKESDAFTFHEIDLREAELEPVIDGADTVFHLAAMAGLMLSWDNFDLYNSCNLNATQRLAAAAKNVKLPQLIVGSTSSAYGKQATAAETEKTEPFSPYGVTKLASENIARAYEANFDVPVTVLRYFSVYGPRQRPDMAYNILINMLLTGEGTFNLYGDGEQSRSNTFVKDAVAGTILAYTNRDKALGETFNLGGGEIISLNEVITYLEELTGNKLNIERHDPRPGDQKHTAANVDKIKRVLGYNPGMGVKEGLAQQVEWQKSLL